MAQSGPTFGESAQQRNAVPDFCFGAKRVNQARSANNVFAVVVLGCAAVTQIIRKLEEPVSAQCGMQPKYRIPQRAKVRGRQLCELAGPNY